CLPPENVRPNCNVKLRFLAASTGNLLRPQLSRLQLLNAGAHQPPKQPEIAPWPRLQKPAFSTANATIISLKFLDRARHRCRRGERSPAHRISPEKARVSRISERERPSFARQQTRLRRRCGHRS